MAEAVKPKTKKKSKKLRGRSQDGLSASPETLSWAERSLDQLPSPPGTQLGMEKDPVGTDAESQPKEVQRGAEESFESSTELTDGNNLSNENQNELLEDVEERLELVSENDTKVPLKEKVQIVDQAYNDENLQTPSLTLPPGVQKKWVTEARYIEEPVEDCGAPSDKKPDDSDPTSPSDILTPESETEQKTNFTEQLPPSEGVNITTFEANAEDETKPDNDHAEQVQENTVSPSSEDTVIKEEEEEAASTEVGDQELQEQREQDGDPEEPAPLSDVTHRKLYPDLVLPPSGSQEEVAERVPSLEPFTDEQLNSLYYNHQLNRNDEFVDSFLQEIAVNKDEFYELVLSYYRARNKLASAEHDISVLQRDYGRYRDLVWELRQETLSVQGQCADKSKVTAEITYTQAVYSEPSCDDVSRTLRDIRTHLQEQLSLYAYEAQLSRIQVESFLHQLSSKNKELWETAKSSPIQALLPHERASTLGPQVSALRACLSVLFLFQRKPTKDDVFVKDTRTWLDRLVATLLRTATLDDHLYLINQLLRCPAGVGQWGAGFVQIIPPPCVSGPAPTWGSPLLDHFVTVMATILLPVRQREALLYQMAVVNRSASEDTAAITPWTILDSDGEEDEDPVNTWHYLQENDLVALLGQLPLDYALRHVLLVELNHRDEDLYDITKTSESSLLRLFAFSTCVVRILGAGLHHFCLSRYRQLNKRLGKMIKTLVQAVSSHWSCFQAAYPALPPETVDRLQLEYNMTIYRAVKALLSAPRLGSWQFLAQLPYSGVSLDMLWRLLWMMHENCYHDNAAGNHGDDPSEVKQGSEEQQEGLVDIGECQQNLRDANLRESFQQKLVVMPTSEAVYLLTTFSNMARCRPSIDLHFIRAVVKEIYEIAYIKTHTRELCSKQGRDLLTSIAFAHPFVLSDLVQITMATMDTIGVEGPSYLGSYIWTSEKTAFFQVALYLYKDLPLGLWTPTPTDLSILRDWLLNRPIASPENQLARLIVERLNWGHDEKRTRLFLAPSLHQHMALLLVDCYTKHLTGMNVGNLVTEGIKQVASMIRFHETDEQTLANWAWEISQRLCLHQGQVVTATDRVTVWPEMPDLYTDVDLQLIVAAVEKQFAVASYLGLMMSKYSHDVGDFCSEGVKLLGSVVLKSHYIPTIKVLYHVTPMFFEKEDYLLNNDKFLQVLRLLMQADSQKRGMFFNVFPGPITKLFAGAILDQVSRASQPGGLGAGAVVLFWVKLLVKLDNWSSDKDTLYILDKLLAAVFSVQQTVAWDKVLDHFSQLYKTLITKDRDPSLLTSISSLFGSSRPLPSLLECVHLAEFPYVVYAVLHVEGVYEAETTEVWPRIQSWLYEHVDVTVEAALQAVCKKLRFYLMRSSSRLCIYRWVQQAVHMEVSHPALPLVWQRFFSLYLGRANTEPGLPQRGSVGERFFQTSANMSLMKKMKKQLSDTVKHYETRARDGTAQDSDDESSSGEDSTPSAPPDTTEDDRCYSLQMVKFYQTLLFWLDEPRLHEASLYLPALPPQYDPKRLQGVLQAQTHTWSDAVNQRAIDQDLSTVVKEWVELGAQAPAQTHPPGNETKQMSASATIVHLLSAPSELACAPRVVQPPCPVPALSRALLCDQQNLLFSLRGDFNILADYAKVYCSRVAKHVGLDCSYVELFPSLYTNETTESAASAVCKSTFNPTHRCKGAAIITGRYEAAKRDSITSRKVDENRAEYNQVLIESLLPPPQNVCSAAVHVEHAITSLINLLKKSPTSAVVLDVGTALFYNVTTFVSEDTKYYPPTCQFFSSCIEILGQEFIRNNPSQSQALLQAILQNPNLVGLLAPNFSPTASPEMFVTMYQDMIPVPSNQGPDIGVTLLTKFEIDKWLEGKPSLTQREALLGVIGQALCQCGKDMTLQMESVFQVYRVHFRHLGRYLFPDHYGSMLKLILKGSGSDQLSPLIWADFLKLLGYTETPQVQSDSAVLASELSKQTILETLDWMASHFLAMRISNTDYTSFGLYPKWKIYIPHLSQFLCFLICRLIMETATQVSVGAGDAELAVSDLWQKIVGVFAPWTQPLTSGDEMLSPWIQNDTEAAEVMVQAWISCVRCLHQQFESLLPPFSKHALSHLWRYYVQMLAQREVPRHIISVYHLRLGELPWENYYPDIQEVDLMVALCSSKAYHRSSQEFLSLVFCRLPWRHISASYSQCEVPEIRARLSVCFFSVTVRMSQLPDALETTNLPALLEQAESFDWNVVDGANYRETVEWFRDNCDPRCVLAERGAQQALVLRLLRVASGFLLVPNATFHPETPVKRCCFVQCLVSLLCKCSHLRDVDPDNFRLVLTNLWTDAEAVMGNIPDAHDQYTESVALCTELLGVLNHCPPGGSSRAALAGAVLGWVSLSTTSPLLLPTLTAACRGLADIKDMVKVTEACVEAYFCGDVLNTEGAGWARLLASLTVPDLARDRFITEALSAGSHLTLYTHMLQTLPLSRSLDDEMDALKTLVFWTSKAKPGPDGECKLLLWWDKTLELLCRQVALGGPETRVADCVKKFVPSLVTLGEEKDHSGLLGAIGLGKRSQLSLRFRILANAMASFVSAQVLSNGTLRKEPNAPGHISEASSGSKSPTRTNPTGSKIGPSQHALQSYQNLSNLKANKKYAMFKEQLEFAATFISDPMHCVMDCQKLFVSLLVSLFPDVNYLAVIRLRHTQV